ncbi:hypothetical protein [Marinobacterium sediminicola]|uniref:Uncharacterized protein n=1 Tax=Marinobacterium sediminicola TaxID=518898 RepID=A0ABY1S1G8_9GAMM|nr:hypothetical protein [Marinobacterium sediminicola]ULG69380.1 hypothetical protein LN244_00795 [Marinobacterium sediminicola]SMR75527.1 hypothetical protein SAMN04487964_11064 [Marinobacterium sediminicola]
MVRLTLVLTVMLAVIGLPEALKPLLPNNEPRLVILTSGEEPYVINPDAREHVELPVPLKQPEALLPTEQLNGPQLSQLQPYAEQLITDSQS